MRIRGYVYIIIALVGAAVYVGRASWQGVVGFALDDAWIHQVYARNLALRGEFAFTPGVTSAGSTSPLWTLVLVPSFWLQIDPRAWAILWGAFLLGLSAVFAVRLSERFLTALPISNGKLVPVLTALAILLEWHLAWGAVSGMEIPLFLFLSLLLLERFYAGERSWVLGIVAGLLFLTRPEGIVLAGIVAAGLVLRMVGKNSDGYLGKAIGASGLLAFVFALVLVLLPYFVFNYAASGTILPNTFYAKNAEYAIIAERLSYPARFLQLFLVPWVGVEVLLAPGVAFITVTLARRKKWLALLPFGWIVLLPALYAWRLPVSYQHGRYEIPVIPVILVYGVWGTAALVERIPVRVIRRTLVLSAAAVLIAFWLIGANAYATDVAIIDCEMVQSAQWISNNVPANSVIAAHDIGAMGYVNNRPLIDLAGLVSPEVIPFIRDETRLREYLFARQVDYAVFFPDWYPLLATDSHFVPIKSMDCPVARQQGATDMTVYQIRHD